MSKKSRVSSERPELSRATMALMIVFGLAGCGGVGSDADTSPEETSLTAALSACTALTAAPVFQVINPSTKANLLTSSQSEANQAAASGFTQNHGTLFYASATSATGLAGAHRMYNAKSKDYFWTINSSEVTSAKRYYGYVDQGIDFYVSPVAVGCGLPVYRFLSGAMHRFAVSQADQAALTAGGWKPEGIKFYGGIPPTTNNNPGGSVMPTGVAGNWTLKFDDEFDGTSLDTSKWSPCWFSPTCGPQNGVGTNPANVSVSGGNLILTLSSTTSGASVSTDPNGGASIGYQFKTGVVEARIFFPGDAKGCYNWPAWWTNGQPVWPANGENDIAEVLDGQVTANYHSPSGAHNFGAIGTSAALCGSWHIYTLYRQVGRSTVYLDGTLVKSYATDDSGNPQFLILNVGYDKNHVMTGSAGAVRVDWVRAWQ